MRKWKKGNRKEKDKNKVLYNSAWFEAGCMLMKALHSYFIEHIIVYMTIKKAQWMCINKSSTSSDNSNTILE